MKYVERVLQADIYFFPSLLNCLLARNYFNPGRNHGLNKPHGTDAL